MGYMPDRFTYPWVGQRPTEEVPSSVVDTLKVAFRELMGDS